MPGARRGTALAILVAGLAVYAATQHAAAFAIPFINDDFVFLDRTRVASFASLWGFRDLAFHWWRPWSRELHFWTLQSLFGARVTPFHAASFALWLASVAVFATLVERLAGLRAAAIANAAVAALAAWGVPLGWAATAQELWMILFVLLTLLAWACNRAALASVALALALLSKETAVVTAPLALAYDGIVRRASPRAALVRALPLIAITALWSLAHPLIGGRLWRSHATATATAAATPPAQAQAPVATPAPAGAPAPADAVGPPSARLPRWRVALVPFNLDRLPAPERGWTAALRTGGPGAVILVALVLIVSRRTRDRSGPEDRAPTPGRVFAFGAVWALLGWAPLFMPALDWHAYYALLGCFGVWLALGALLAARPALGAAAVAALALIAPARADTPSLDWGSPWYLARSAEFLAGMRAGLMGVLPHPAPHARFFFVRVPSNVGFMNGDGPALRVWYGDPTLTGGYYSAFRARAAGEARGPDYFFRFDSTSRWIEVVAGAKDTAAARRADPRWESDHVMLATTLAKGGDWSRAAGEWVKLADAAPAQVDYAYDAAVAFESLGDSTGAARWYTRAAALPGADPDARAMARRFERYLNGRPPSR
ncbi:MAG: hypothetical protein HY076_08275 [Candidatus Eisenbacteria bacterium]|uniref:Tetratricopeptide repeat protein n=1 Tax=Eiseniibacteriota bacterium TaxID=2212470 RepID=A0A9D6L7B7_UNCEI|nr:hypothetical protein [Candidatus Eisenbacteria bacterium]